MRGAGKRGLCVYSGPIVALNSRESCRLRQTILTLYNSWQWPSPRMNSFRRAVRCVNVVLAIVQCPSVCPSVTLVYCIETAKDHQTISGSDKPIVLAFWAHPALQNSKRKPLSGHKIFGIGKNRNFHFFSFFILFICSKKIHTVNKSWMQD